MIKIQFKLPRKLFVACSGGADSMAALSFLTKNHDVTVAYFNHGTDFGNKSEHWIEEYCRKENLKLVKSTITREKSTEESQEEYWRNERYAWLNSLPGEVVTAHHLDDCVETWVWSAMHGNGKIIPYRNKNVIRPFRLTEKNEFVSWVNRKNIEYLDDPSNSDTKYMRNYIRNDVMPHILKINPGIKKTIYKKVMATGV